MHGSATIEQRRVKVKTVSSEMAGYNMLTGLAKNYTDWSVQK